MKKYDVIIVGAGPAGLKCAEVLEENNINYIVLERRKKIERKICTGLFGITKKTKEMGLPDSLFERTFSEVLISTPYERVVVRKKDPFVATLDRKTLGEWMYRNQNVSFGSIVTHVANDYVIVDGEKLYFKYLVGADGSSSIVRKSIGLPFTVGMAVQYWLPYEMENLEIHFDSDKFGPWYGWIAPHNGKTSIGSGGDPKVIPISKIKSGLNSWLCERNISLDNSTFEGAPINYNYQGYNFGNKFLIGDSAGFASGLSGEGIYFAMASGLDVGRKIVDGNYKMKHIDLILKIKRKHEIILKAFELNNFLEKIEYELLVNLLRFKFFDDIAIDVVA